MKIYDYVKENLDKLGINFNIGQGFKLSGCKLKYAPYLKVTFTKKGIVDLGAFLTILGDVGLSAGIRITKKKNKAKVFIDTGICTELRDEIDLAKMDFKLHGGFRIVF